VIDPTDHGVATDIAARGDACMEILEQVKKIVGGPRREAYGEPEDGYQCIAGMWNAWLAQREKQRPGPLEPADVIAMMEMIKLARLAVTIDHTDSWRDLIGYGALGGRVSKADLTR
jgi:hypothetical protein